MARRITLLFILASAIAIGAVSGLKETHASTWKGIWKRIMTGGENLHSIGRFKVGLIDTANNARTAISLPILRPDQELESWLQKELEAGLIPDDLDALVAHVQKAWPRYLKLRVSSATGPTLDLVRDSFHDYLHQTEAEMTHMASARRTITGGISHQVFLVTGHRLRDFSPDLLHRTKDDAFYNVCPLCKTSHISRAMRHQESSSLECPSCRRTYAVIAADTDGQFHYVNEYLTGYEPPSIYPRGQSRVEQLFTIWSAVHTNCTYTRDPGIQKEKSDRWQTALETQTRGRGDCEDSSIFLADWLTSRGYEVRVALGKYGDIGGHAWCVVRLDGKEYLLESTSEGRPDFDQPPLVSRIGSRYIPEVLFDRFNLYVRQSNHQIWNGDYWSSDQWISIKQSASSEQDMTLSASVQREPENLHTWIYPSMQSVQKDFFSSSRLAYTYRTDPRGRPFFRLEQTVDQPTPWQFPAAIPGTPGTADPEP
jgi:hypothetical protein